MNDRNMDRERHWRDREDDDNWDWYYYEYRYLPYSSYGEDYGDRETYGRESDYDYRSRYYGSHNRGPYSGVGPRGYRRSDERIEDDVNDRLTQHGYIDASDIQVKVDDGVVTLTGSVNSRFEKRMAENTAERVSGVWDINNNLRINRQRDWNRGWGGGMEMEEQIREGMEVVGKDGEDIGQVKEVRNNDFLVDRSMARDVYIPFQAAQFMDGRIRLNVRADEVDDQGWPVPELFDTSETKETSSKKR